MKGVVKFFHDRKKYGFIATDEGEEDVFFHISELEGDSDSIEEGAEVEFEQEEGDKGPKAVNIKEV